MAQHRHSLGNADPSSRWGALSKARSLWQDSGGGQAPQKERGFVSAARFLQTVTRLRSICVCRYIYKHTAFATTSLKAPSQGHVFQRHSGLRKGHTRPPQPITGAFSTRCRQAARRAGVPKHLSKALLGLAHGEGGSSDRGVPQFSLVTGQQWHDQPHANAQWWLN